MCLPLQIGREKHQMLNLFMQVPEMVRTRLAKRCKEVYEFVRQAQNTADDVEQDEILQQVSWEYPPTCPTRPTSLSNSAVPCPSRPH